MHLSVSDMGDLDVDSSKVRIRKRGIKKVMKSSDYDARIDKAEKQLKEWKAKRRELATKEAKAAKKAAEAKRLQELQDKGIQYEDIEEWMKANTITIDGMKITVWQWYERRNSNPDNHPVNDFQNGIRR